MFKYLKITNMILNASDGVTYLYTSFDVLAFNGTFSMTFTHNNNDVYT